MTPRKILLTTLALALLATGCTRRKPIWVYTDLPSSVVAEMNPSLQQAVRNAQVKWVRGSEPQIVAKLSKALKADGDRHADLVIVGDPLWYMELKRQGALQAYDSPAAKDVPAQWIDPDHAFSAVRVSAIVLGYNADKIPPNALPMKWSDLTQPQWKGRVAMPNPLVSGKGFAAVAVLAKAFGWDFFSRLRQQHIAAIEGNDEVISQLESGERDLGIVSLGHVLRARYRNSVVHAIFPLDGIAQIPGPIALLKSSAHPGIAKLVYDWFFSPAAQNAIIHGGMYSPLAKVATPDGARPWPSLKTQLLPWDFAALQAIDRDRDQIRGKFSEVVFH